MNAHFKRAAALALSLALGACGKPAATGKIRIGLSLDTLKEERWQRDRDYFTAKARQLGAEVLVQAANSNDVLQNTQAENLLTQGVDVLVVVPHNGKMAASIVRSAHAAKVPVIAYDRLITDSDPDLYVSFDGLEVGRQQARYAVEHAPKGNYVLIAGAPTDHNARLFHDGQMEVLSPLVKKGDITIVTDQWAVDWQPLEGLKIMENALTKAGNQVAAVVVSNDGLAGGAIQALREQGMAGKVVVTGQDADLVACRRLVEGTQSMTIYKPIRLLAETAAEWAVKLAKKEPVKAPASVNNGSVDVPSILIAPVTVDSANLKATVIAEGFHSRAEVYGN